MLLVNITDRNTSFSTCWLVCGAAMTFNQTQNKPWVGYEETGKTIKKILIRIISNKKRV